MDAMSEPPDIPEDVVDRINAAAADVIQLHELVAQLALSADEREAVLGQLAAVFEYHEPFAGGQGDADRFRPMFEMEGRRYPPLLSEVPAEVAALWLAAADAIQTPIARARLNDVCFVAGWGNRGERARAAIDARLDFADALGRRGIPEDRALAEFERIGHLARALSLARHISDADRATRVVDAIRAAIDQSFDQPKTEPGVTLGYVEILVDDSKGHHDVTDLLARARELYAGDLHNSAETIKIQLKQSGLDEATRTVLHRALVNNSLDQADEAESGLVRLVHLEAAVQLATRYHQDDLRDEATSRLQQIGIDDLDLKATSFTYNIPTEQFEAHIAQFTDQPTWQEALLLLIASAPPSGIASENRRDVAESTSIASIFPHVRIGGDGLPRYTASTDDERAEYNLVSREMVLAQLTAVFVAETLARIWAKWGPINVDDLTEFFAQGSHVRDEVAAALARDFLRYFNGDHEGAAHTASAHAETLVRDLALAIPLPIYKIQRQENPGQYPGLGTLLPALRARNLDESWFRFIDGFLAKPIGANQRNELLHGLELDPSEAKAALVLVCVLFLARGVQLVAAPPTEPPAA